MRKKFFLFTLLIIGALSLTNCGKKNFLSKQHLTFSVDTLVFDTVFTSTGSATHQFKIYNPENRTVHIDEIELMGGENSPFRMNVDGLKGIKMQDIDLEGKDSLFVFVEVTLGINGQNLPMVVEDSIRFRTNGVDQYVKLAVWGQDAYFHYHDLNEGIWPNDKPHVIYGYAAVDSNKTLTIPAGTQIHLHKNALLYVYKSTLNVQGTLGNEVVFQGDRLEQSYKDVAGQYYGIYFQEALPSTIDYAIIKNGTAGVHLYSKDASTASNYTLTLTNTLIQNQARYGVFIYSGARVKAENCIISKNGTHSLLVLEGGDFNFNHCDVLGYGTSSNPAIGLSNYYTDASTNTTNVGSIHTGVFRNCIITGNMETELGIDTLLVPGVEVNLQFDHCLIKYKDPPIDGFYESILWNSPPLFIDVSKNDFKFSENSVLNGNGIFSSVITDIFGQPRNNPPDIGAIEMN